MCFICSASRPHAVSPVETHIHREVVVFGVLEWGVDGDTSTPARPSQCRCRLPPRVAGLLATRGALWYWEIWLPGFRRLAPDRS